MKKRDSLDAKLRELAEKVVEMAISGKFDDEYDKQIETLKVAGNYFTATTRAKKGSDTDDDTDTMTAVQARIRAAERQPGGHA
jgi:hypothetical protein